MSQIHKGTLALAAVLVAACSLPVLAAGRHAGSSAWGAGADDKAFAAMLATGFKEHGAVKLDRLKQDETQVFCSNPANHDGKETKAKREKIEADNYATVKWPSDNVWLGDWKEGEKLAQSGRGLTWTDKPTQVNGGNCYNCHQLDPKEISYGTIGPSLYQYGKTKGFTGDTLRYTWAKIYNGKSLNACSNMPRAGHMGILDEKQIRNLMALLLDPASPVNK
jgi:L-cysteine S-thiosulfotransferase